MSIWKTGGSVAALSFRRGLIIITLLKCTVPYRTVPYGLLVPWQDFFVNKMYTRVYFSREVR